MELSFLTKFFFNSDSPMCTEAEIYNKPGDIIQPKSSLKYVTKY